MGNNFTDFCRRGWYIEFNCLESVQDLCDTDSLYESQRHCSCYRHQEKKLQNSVKGTR